MSELQPFFLESAHGLGQRFCIFHPAQGLPAARGRVLHIHPFAEEMNKSRRMAALQARALARAGFAVLQIDLHGCGDSSSDFGDASWQGWLDDLTQAVAWLDDQGQQDLYLWGHRAGCLLACALAQRLSQTCHFLFWQPPSQGRLLLQQFLRLKLAGALLEGHAAATMDVLKQKMAVGESVEIAGYALSPELALGLEQAGLMPPKARPGRAHWFELGSQETGELSPALMKAGQAWRDAGVELQMQRLQGPAFWQTSEIEEAPALLQASCQALLAGHVAELSA